MRLPRVDADDLLPLSALQHWSYCPRQCALIHAEQAFAENLHTARGRAVHALVDAPAGERSAGRRIERGMPLWCDRLGLVGKADVVEFAADGTPYPIEYKHGPRRQRRHDELQLAAQALCLEEMTGRTVPCGAIYHHSSHRRRGVVIDAALRAEVEVAVVAVRAMLSEPRLPPPVADARCRQCSLIELCQPRPLADRRRYAALLQELTSP